jgi:K+-sensing histidine kinase KdpD
LSYAVSHDLRSPLKTIDGFSHLLGKKLAGSDNEKALYFLSRIQSGVAQMARLIADLLALAQVTRTQIQHAPVNLSTLAGSIIADLQVRHPASKPVVNIEAGLLAHGDAGLLQVVLENLLDNAWKYSSKQPGLTSVKNWMRKAIPYFSSRTMALDLTWPMRKTSSSHFSVCTAWEIFPARVSVWPQ